MPKFFVRISLEDIEVEAESRIEAISKAKDLIPVDLQKNIADIMATEEIEEEEVPTE